MYILLSFIAILYLWFGDQLEFKKQELSSVSSFIKSDAQLSNVLKQLKIIESFDIHVYNSTIQNVTAFIEQYLRFFKSDRVNSLDFQTFLDKRRTILNDLMELIVTAPILDKHIENIVKNLSDCTWKYVHVIGTKYDISIDIPLPKNAFIGQDLF